MEHMSLRDFLGVLSGASTPNAAPSPSASLLEEKGIKEARFMSSDEVLGASLVSWLWEFLVVYQIFVFPLRWPALPAAQC